MPWIVSIRDVYVYLDKDGKIVLKEVVRPDPSVYRQTVCKLMTRLGDVLSGGRRRRWSWFLDSTIRNSEFLLRSYIIFRNLILYGKHERSWYEIPAHSKGRTWIVRRIWC
jgi:hypothetical protein